MTFTDYELKRASQIAYYKINKQCFEEINTFFNNKNPDNYTLRNLYNHSETFKNILAENIRVVAGFDEGSDCSLANKDKVLAVLALTSDNGLYSRVREMYETIEDIIDESEDGICFS